MNYATTSNEMQALLFADPEFQQALDDTLLNAFWSEVGPNNYVNKEEDVRCAWSNLPLAEKNGLCARRVSNRAGLVTDNNPKPQANQQLVKYLAPKPGCVKKFFQIKLISFPRLHFSTPIVK